MRSLRRLEKRGDKLLAASLHNMLKQSIVIYILNAVFKTQILFTGNTKALSSLTPSSMDSLDAFISLFATALKELKNLLHS
jgi:hypothetical protein